MCSACICLCVCKHYMQPPNWIITFLLLWTLARRGKWLGWCAATMCCPELPGACNWKMPELCFKTGKLLDFAIQTSIDLKEGQLLNKLLKISKPTNLKRVEFVPFWPRKGQTWQPWCCHIREKQSTINSSELDTYGYRLLLLVFRNLKMMPRPDGRSFIWSFWPRIRSIY